MPTQPRRLWWLIGLAGALAVIILLAAGAIWLITRRMDASQAQTDQAQSTPTTAGAAAPGPVSADLLFFDHFNEPGLNRALWNSTSGGGQIQVFNSFLRLTSAGQSFPLVYSIQNPFPDQGNFRLKVRLRYLSAAERGSGVMLGRLPADFEQGGPKDRLIDEQMIGLWQDTQSWRILMAADPESLAQLAPNQELAELQIDYIDQIYRASLNGREIYSSNVTTLRPNVLWVGNPTQAESGGDWSGLEIDYISVERLPGALAAMPSPTFTPAAPPAEPSPTPTPPPTPSPMATTTALGQNCPGGVDSLLAAAWEQYRQRLGCPVGGLQVIPTIAEEVFQGGHLFWRSDTDEVYIILDRQFDGAELNEGRWQPAEPGWKWDGSSPDGIGLSPPPGLVEPKRGFGWLWRNHLGGADGPLGWALDKEYGFDNLGQAQSFEAGLLFKGSSSKIYILLDNGTFYTY
jgi:hypothetical protein